ncbi:hypothetical protein L1987_56957 [Smallanthus sonchifolius]|uniref:Uncharacterized protein n=1 Tax=Smallanthus sonchifolius TaxID=185202 RepID=A0ACB9DBP6_9ASTR|nr:hypothetical protein L1987_56957 [Smallanthus sonchifolius]
MLSDSDELPESNQIGTEPGVAMEGIPAVNLDSKGLHESTLHGGCKKSMLGPGKISTLLSNFSKFGLNNQCNFDGMFPSNGASRLDGLSRNKKKAVSHSPNSLSRVSLTPKNTRRKVKRKVGREVVRMEESAVHTTEDSENHGGGEKISEEN